MVKATLSGAEARTDPAFDEAAVCHVNWWVDAYPITLNLPGTTPDSSGGENILIGQGCSASLACNAPGVTFSNFQWTIGGETFKSYDRGNTVATTFSPSHPYGRVSYLGMFDLVAPSPHWFWSKGEDFGGPQTVSCTATVSINGSSIGSVTASKVVNVWRPYFKFSATSLGVNINGHPGVPGVAVVGNINWFGSVGTPNLFRSYWGNTGSWQFTQLCNLYRFAAPAWISANTGGPVLDAEFNYSSKEGAPWPADSTDVAPIQQISGDAPTADLFAHDNVTIDDSFQTYMLYEPPGNDVQWVTINKMDWTWQCGINYISGNPGTYSPNPPGVVKVLDNTASSDFPLWEDYYADTSGN